MNDLVTVFTAQGLVLAELVKGRLEASGIPVFLRHEAVQPMLPVTVNGLGEVQVQVPASLAEQASALLEQEMSRPVRHLYPVDDEPESS